MEQIANEVGYNCASQLARVFRKYEGVSPSAFRNDLQIFIWGKEHTDFLIL
ncbi:MAG: AraC family transcriptional regulator [Roseburia sp.]|nr:AraC family transcriptional regulator [Roseburia sp.]